MPPQSLQAMGLSCWGIAIAGLFFSAFAIFYSLQLVGVVGGS